MPKCTIHIDDEVNCRIGGLHPTHIKVLYDEFGLFVDGYFYMPLYQLRRWDGKVHFFSEAGVTYTKLLDRIVPYLVGWNYDVDINDKRVGLTPLEPITDDVFGELPSGFKFRPYQVESVNKLIEATCGFGKLATGSGKTSMCAALALRMYQAGLKVLIIVPSTDLVEQTAAEMRERYLNFPDLYVGTYSGDSKNIDEPITVATWQSLQNAPHYMASFTGVIVDEAHGAKAEVIKKLINTHGGHIGYRYGVTGTIPKDDTDQMTLHVSIGPVVCDVPASWLIEQGYLSSVEINAIETQDIVEELPDYSSEKAYLSKNEERLQALANLIMAKRDEHGNTMALVSSISQGQELADLIPGAVFLYGSSGKDERKHNYAQYADQDGLIIIASVGIASTGISIDRIFCLFMIDIGKSFTRCIQTVGRGLRKKGDKNHVFVYDVFSKLKFSKKHYKKRKEYYVEACYPVSKTPIKLKYDAPQQTNHKGVTFE